MTMLSLMNILIPVALIFILYATVFEGWSEIRYLSYLPTPPLGQDMTQGQFFRRSFTGLNSEFFFLLD